MDLYLGIKAYVKIIHFKTSELQKINKKMGGVSKSMLKQSRLNFDKIEKCE